MNPARGLSCPEKTAAHEGMHGDITVGTHRATDRDPGLEHEEILYRFLTVLRRFAACYADSATENAKRLLPNDVRVKFAENCNPDLELLPPQLV